MNPVDWTVALLLPAASPWFTPLSVAFIGGVAYQIYSTCKQRVYGQ